MSRRGVWAVAATIAVLSLAVVAMMAAGGDDGDASPTQYAADVCRSIASYEDDLRARVEEVGRQSREATTPDERRGVAVSLFRDVGIRIDRLVEEVEGAGQPAGERGEELAADLGEAFAAVARLVDRATDDARALRGDDFTGLDQDLRNSGALVSDALTRIRSDHQGTPAGEALADEQACEEVGALGG